MGKENDAPSFLELWQQTTVSYPHAGLILLKLAEEKHR